MTNPTAKTAAAPALMAVRCTFLKCSAPLTFQKIYHARLGPDDTLFINIGNGVWKQYLRSLFWPLNPDRLPAFISPIIRASLAKA